MPFCATALLRSGAGLVRSKVGLHLRQGRTMAREAHDDRWNVSRRCDTTNCLEVLLAPDAVLVRHSAQPENLVLEFHPRTGGVPGGVPRGPEAHLSSKAELIRAIPEAEVGDIVATLDHAMTTMIFNATRT
jgi:hypothetical protein